jgi:metallo-beta-lactamase class B
MSSFFEGYIPPSRIFGNVYFVGTRPASTHIIQTDEGIILIDPGFPEALGQITENIGALGLDVRDIRIILLSHGHYDHAGAARALAELTGADIYVGEGDAKMVSGDEDTSLSEIFGVKYKDHFIPDRLLRDGDVISLGSTEILCLSTQGHTDGTFSFFFDVTDGERVLRAGMFGGAGTNTLTDEFLSSHGLTVDNRDKFLSSVRRLKEQKVDVFLGNHVGNNDTAGKIMRALAGERDVFIDPSGWLDFLIERERRIIDLMGANM